MRTRISAALALALFFSFTAASQDAGDPAQPATAKKNDKVSLNFGPDGDGFAAKLKGSSFLTSDRLVWNTGKQFVFADLSVDGIWSTKNSTLDHIDIAVKPGWMLSTENSAYRLGSKTLEIGLDIRQKFGEYKNADDTATDVNQLVAGVVADVVIPWSFMLTDWIERNHPDPCVRPPAALPTGLPEVRPADCPMYTSDDPPSIGAGYYTVRDTSATEQPVPDDVKANHLIVKLESNLTVPYVGIPIRDQIYPFRLQIEASMTKPYGTDDDAWQDYLDAALIFDTRTKVKPALRYVSGEKGGFKFDRSIIAGVVWELFRRDEAK
jgi:hypothetical protein